MKSTLLCSIGTLVRTTNLSIQSCADCVSLCLQQRDCRKWTRSDQMIRMPRSLWMVDVKEHRQSQAGEASHRGRMAAANRWFGALEQMLSRTSPAQ